MGENEGELQQPVFPGADEVGLSKRWMRDLEDLGRSLAFTNPQELLAHWEYFVQRLGRAGERFEAEAVASFLLREMYRQYRRGLEASARRVAALKANPRVPEAEVERAQRLLQAQVDYHDKIVAVLPQLRKLMGEAASEL